MKQALHIVLTPEQKDAIQNKFLEHLKKIAGKTAYYDLYNDWGGDVYIDGTNYADIEDDPAFLATWNEAFLKHMHKWEFDKKFMVNVEKNLNYSLEDDMGNFPVDGVFTKASFKKAILDMEKDVKEFLKSDKGQEITRKAKDDSAHKAEELKVQLEKLGYDVTLKKKS